MMEPKDDFEVDHLTSPTGTSFSQLLFGDDDEDGNNALVFGVDHAYNYNLTHHHHPPVFSIDKAPKMLCFGNYQTERDLLLPETNSTPQKSVITSSDSSSASSCNHGTTAINSLSKPNSVQKKRNGSGQQPVTKAGDGGQRAPKKTKAENLTSTVHVKRKEKLGERIAALQQLVSPFGKTDTASVLHEAMGYIRFLHDQVQVLCSPYLQRMPSSTNQHQHQHQHLPGDGDNNGMEEEEEEDSKDLRSRGLCLVPVECTVHVASSNGADFWSPAAIANNSNNNDNNNVSSSA